MKNRLLEPEPIYERDWSFIRGDRQPGRPTGSWVATMEKCIADKAILSLATALVAGVLLGWFIKRR
jgi:hypothetical protein